MVDAPSAKRGDILMCAGGVRVVAAVKMVP